jgi:putative methyltransferase (TIGR04325 family)
MNLNILAYKLRKRYYYLFGEPTYPTFEAALKDCVTKGYENEAVIKLIKATAVDFRKNFKSNPLPNPTSNGLLLILYSIINLVSKNKKKVNVIDFGGADGVHYVYLRDWLDKDINLNWHVVETPEMVAAMKDIETPELTFHDNLEQLLTTLDDVDIVHTSGTLAYTPDPNYFLNTLCNIDSKYKLFSRQSLNTGDKEIISIQRSLLSWHGTKELLPNIKNHEIRYPQTNIPVDKFESILKKNHDFVFKVEDNSGLKKVTNEHIICRNYVIKQK